MTSPSSLIRDSRGATLMELLAVLFIIVLSMSIVGIKIGRSYEKTVTGEEAVRLRNTMRHAREVALLERTPMSVVISTETASYHLLKNSAPYKESIDIARGLHFSGPEVLVFSPTGESTGGTYIIKDQLEKGFAVEVDPVTGSARILRL